MRGAFFALLYHWVMQRTISRKSDPVHFFWAAPMGQILMPPPGDNRRPLQPSGEDCFRRGRPPGQPSVSRCTSCPSFVGWGDPVAVPKISALPYGGRVYFSFLPPAAPFLSTAKEMGERTPAKTAFLHFLTRYDHCRFDSAFRTFAQIFLFRSVTGLSQQQRRCR